MQGFRAAASSGGVTALPRHRAMDVKPPESPRVAVVYPMPFGDEGHIGGGERYARELARALAEKVPTRFVLFGQRRYRYREGRLLVEVYPWLTLLHGQRNNPLGFGFLRSLLRVDVIHCVVWHTVMTDMAIMLAKMMRKRIIVTDVGGGGCFSLLRWFDLGQMVDGFYVLSQFAARSFAQSSAKCRVIYGGTAIPPLAQTADPLRAGGAKLLFVGRLLRHKGIDILLQAAPPSVPLTIVGRPYDVEYFAYLQHLAVGKRVTFVTDAGDARLAGEFRSSTTLVHPAVYDGWGGVHTDVPELFGLAVVEGMAHALPTVVSSAGSLPELVVDGETGFVVPPGDVDALRRAILHLVSDPALAQRMGLAARERVIRLFSWSAVADRCLCFYAGKEG